jgi:uncharacterized protein YndB with AHSA1/START domain
MKDPQRGSSCQKWQEFLTKRGQKMSQLSTQVQIKVPVDKLWKALADLDSLSQWVPDNTRSETASQNSKTMTTAQYYDANPFHNVEERVNGWEEDHHYAYEVKNIGLIKCAYNRFSLNSVSEVETVLTQTLDFQMKLGPVGALMDTLVFRPQFRKQMEQSLAALKEYVEHNEAVDTIVDLALAA